MVDAASGAVPERVLTQRPGAPHHLLLPGLVDAQVGGVDEAAQDQVSEVLAEVIKCHPWGTRVKDAIPPMETRRKKEMVVKVMMRKAGRKESERGRRIKVMMMMLLRSTVRIQLEWITRRCRPSHTPS